MSAEEVRFTDKAMSKNNHISIESSYKASLTREQFLFYEMRATARLMQDGLDDVAVANEICQENLFQYPTEKSLRRMATLCISRLRAMGDEDLIRAVATLPVDESKQICLYAYMKHSRLVWDFMVTVIGNKFRQQDMSFSKADLNMFFLRLQEQNNVVADWSASTITKIKQILMRVLIETDYLNSNRAECLNPVLLCKVLENSIRANGDEVVLPAFNCFN